MNIDVRDIIELEDNKNYVIVEKYEEGNYVYLMLLELDGEEVTENIKYVKIEKGKNNEVITLTESEENQINEILLPLFEQEYVD